VGNFSEQVWGDSPERRQRLLERQGFCITDPLPDTDDVRYTLSLA